MRYFVIYRKCGELRSIAFDSEKKAIDFVNDELDDDFIVIAGYYVASTI